MMITPHRISSFFFLFLLAAPTSLVVSEETNTIPSEQQQCINGDVSTATATAASSKSVKECEDVVPPEPEKMGNDTPKNHDTVSSLFPSMVVDTTLLLELANAQIEWLEQIHGGMVEKEMIHIQPISSLTSSRDDDNDDDTTTTQKAVPLGWFANKDIPKDTVLMKIPRSALFTPGSNVNDPCKTAERLVEEYKKGDQSEYAPYVRYIFASNPTIPLLPSYWSKLGKDVIQSIIGLNLPPNHLLQITYKECVHKDDKNEDEDDADNDSNRFAYSAISDGDEYDSDINPSDESFLFELAYAAVTSRSWDEKLVPVFDVMNHGSGDRFNVDSTSVHDESVDRITVFARRDISKGEQLHLSYMENVDDYDLRFTYLLPELLRDYGFVDQYPQRWSFPTYASYYHDDMVEHPPMVVFDVVQTELPSQDNGSSNDKPKVSYSITWRIPQAPPKHEYVIENLEEEFDRITKLSRYVTAYAKNIRSDHEREIIQQYYRSIYTALKEALHSITGDVELVDFDDMFTHIACEDFELIWARDGEWKYIEEVKSHHQEIQIYYQPKQDDACLLLGDYLHACASNRPHYHEVFVHYPAYFLDKVKRVLFIGGGDSMVLHEVLKYKDLEKIVGLELDQKVVRTVFKRFGTQPHFENDKVEWYFGDAAAAMRVLPTEYYGTFDLVVVDILTSVAESLKVTEKYSIMEAAMLLLHPNGIIIKNEDEGYKPGSSVNFTKHMVDIVYHDVPVYCLQTFVMGSNGIDFVNKNPIDHGVPLLYLKPVDEFKSQFDTWYTTTTNPAFLGVSGKDDGNEEEDDDEEEDEFFAIKSNGLAMIIEAEKTTILLSSSSTLQLAIFDVLEKQKLSQIVVEPSMTNLRSRDKELEGGYSLNFLFKEGSVVARCFPLINYCAFDIQLWSALQKMEGIKGGLIGAVKSQQSSIYRIIATGLDEGTSEEVGPPPRVQEEKSVNTANETKESSSSFVKMANSTIHWRNATLHSYDNTDALKQWESQEMVGIQTLLQFKAIPRDFDPKNTTIGLGKMFKTLFKVASSKNLVPNGVEVRTYKLDETNGNGDANIRVFTASWESGNLVAFWDGTSRLDVNMFSLTESEPFAFELVKLLISKLKWALYMAESFPRGIGRIINFSFDYATRHQGERPYWA